MTREQPRIPIWWQEIQKLTETPAGSIALHAISGAEPPYFEPNPLKVFSDIQMALSLSVATRLNEATKNMDDAARIAFFQEFIAALNTIWIDDMREKLRDADSKNRKEILEVYERVPNRGSTGGSRKNRYDKKHG